MTPKEKAQELFNKMFNIPDGGFGSIGVYEAKQCALIAVDEILKLQQARLIVGRHNYYDYYIEVKEEIEKL
jgi:hypothetical protein